MTFSHMTHHSFNPTHEFWRTIENLISSFPFWEGGSKWKSQFGLIKFYELQTNEAFDVDNSDTDIYGDLIQDRYIIKNMRSISLKDIPEIDRRTIPPESISYRVNEIGKIIKFLSNHISNSDTVNKFQHFFEVMCKYLKEIHNFNPENDVIKSHGLGNKNDANYEIKKEEFILRYLNKEKGLIKLKDFIEYFNSVCRQHGVPFVMFEQNNECYVVHTTDIFIERIIQNIPLFLNYSELDQANNYFIKAYRERDNENYPECLNNIRKGMEEVRNFIYDKYSIANRSGNLYNDLELVFDMYNDVVFDYTKIPETNQNRVEKIINKFKESVLLSVKLTNIGSHSSSVPDLIEENTTLFVLGLVASILPYLIYLLK
ncbi:MAG: hypothetical protein ACFFD2_20875 [Promethearchaeota archaeon]